MAGIPEAGAGERSPGRGFTLIELLVVIAISAILAARLRLERQVPASMTMTRS